MADGASANVTVGGHDVRAVANMILAIADRKGIPLTIMQLLKLIFFAHGWTLALFDRPLSANKAQAWQYGPVFPHVYKSYPGAGSQRIDQPIIDKRTGRPFASHFSQEDLDVMESVVDGYGHHHAFSLSAITHAEGSPWHHTFNNVGAYTDIDDALIKDYFKASMPK